VHLGLPEVGAPGEDCFVSSWCVVCSGRRVVIYRKLKRTSMYTNTLLLCVVVIVQWLEVGDHCQPRVEYDNIIII